MEYVCEDKFCTYEGRKPFVLKIPQEVSVDTHNIATLFCPHCGSALKKRNNKDARDDMMPTKEAPIGGPQASLEK